MSEQQWPGLITAADAHDIPRGAATTQDNFQSREPGKLTVRKGVRPFDFDHDTGATTDVIAMYGYMPILTQYAVHLTSDGKVYFGHAESINPVETSVCAERPPSWAETREGHLIRVNGLERGSFWDGADLWPLGITAPTSGPTVVVDAGAGGATAGTYYCAYRYIDAEGNPSSLSDLTEIESVENDDGFDWSGITLSSESRVTQIQLFRSTVDESDTLYLVTTLTNTGTPAYDEDDDDDDTLNDNTALPILYPDGSLCARRFEPPPETMEVVVPFQDRYWYAVVAKISRADYAANVTGYTTKCIGRYAYKEDALPKEITAWSDTTGYSYIYGAATERNLIYFSEVDEPESVPAAQNQIVIQENTDDNDYITGLMPFGNVLWVLKERHVYRLTFVRQPTIDAGVTLAYARGCVNQRCWDFYEDTAFLMDEYGCWMLTPGGYQPISAPVEDYFRDRTIDFSKSRWFFVAVEPNEAIVRFYVAFDGDTGTRPKRALCYSIRTQTWWTESFLWELAGSCRIGYSNQTRLLIGSEDGMVFLVSEGTTDIVDAEVSGTISSYSASGFGDSEQTFTSAHNYAPVVITGGTGKGQVRRIVTGGGGCTITPDWDTIPDDTSTYIVGGIKGRYISGLAELENYPESREEDGGEHAMLVTFQPTTDSYKIDVTLLWDHETSGDDITIRRTDGPITWPVGQAQAEIDTERSRAALGNSPGYARVPFHDRPSRRALSHRFVSTELVGYQGDETIAVYAFSYEP